MTFRSEDRMIAARVRVRRRPAIVRSLAALAVVAAAGCAAGGGGAVASRDVTWSEDLGRMNKATLDQGVAKIVQKHDLRIDRDVVRPREVVYETAWTSRVVHAEEEARGVTNARNRIVLRGRLLEQGFGAGGENYRVTWELQNEVTTAAATGWYPDVIPAGVLEHYRPIFRELSMETRTGVRR